MSLLRKKKFRVVVFCVSGALILYNVWFFTLGKKKPASAPKKPKAAAESAEPGNGGSGDTASARGAWGEVHPKPPAADGEGALPAAGAAIAFGRDPFLLPDEESAGKTFETLFRERLEASRGAQNTPLHEVLAQLGVLELTGILHDARRPVAVINHRLVHAGDSLLNGYFDVVAIDAEAVRVRHGGKDFVIPLPEKKKVGADGGAAREVPAAAPAEKE